MRLIDADKIVYSWQIDADGQEHDGVALQSIINKMPTIEPERKKGTPLLEKREWIDGYENRWYRKKFYCASCGIKIRTESWNEKRCFGEGTILQDNNMPNFCPNCGADIREEQDGKSD